MSTYTSNSGIEKPVAGSQSGTWGNTVNTNMDILDRSINGVLSLTLSGTTSTLTTTDGTLSNGQNKLLVLGGSLSAGHTITVSPSDAQKIYFVKNDSGQTVTFTQGSGSTTVAVANGNFDIVYADGSDECRSLISSSSLTVDATTFKIDGTDVTTTAAELNILDGVTATTEELNILDGVTATTEELNILDGVTATTAELNVLDGDTAATATTLEDADRAVVNDDGTMVQVAMTDFTTYFNSNINPSGITITDSELAGATIEKFTNDTSAATGVVNFDCKTQAVYLNSANASGNVQLNFRGDGSTTFADIVPVGKSLTAVYAVNNGSTPYYVSDVRIDGTSQLSSQEFFWQGGTQPSSGNASGMDVYTFTFFRRHSTGWTVFADRTFYGT